MTRRFTPSRGGHAPGHLREVFAIGTDNWPSALLSKEAEVWWDDEMAAQWSSMTAEQRARWLTGQLWNCSDIMPSGMCEDLGLPPGSTYAQGARHLRTSA